MTAGQPFDDGGATRLHRQARSLLPAVVSLRRRIHCWPEVGLNLPRTQQAVLDSLVDLDVGIRLGKRISSIVATLIGGRPGPTVLLRADMDALPITEDTGLDFASETDGVMHACGHDAHAAILAGAVRLLSSQRQELAGTVQFMFQPGEEADAGARVMLEEGLLDPDALPVAAFALHTTPMLACGQVGARAGSFMASSDRFSITLRGKGGHASTPYLTLDPIPAACELVLAVQSLVTRRLHPLDPAVVSVTQLAAGTAYNVIPATAFLQGTVRAFSAKTRRDALDGLTRAAHGVAAAHQLTVDVDIEQGYPATINDAHVTAQAVAVARALVGEDNIHMMPNPVFSAEDFSFVLQHVPGAMVLLGSRPVGVDDPPNNHTGGLLVNEEAMVTGMALHAGMALTLLAGGAA